MSRISFVFMLCVGMFPAFILGAAPPKSDRVASLIEMLRGNDLIDRYEAIEALGEIGTEASDALPHLSVLLHDPNEIVQIAAAQALTRIAPADEGVTKSATEVLVGLLGQKDVQVSSEAESVLVDIGVPAVPALVTAVTSTLPEARRRAAAALGRIGPAAGDAVPVILRLLDDRDATVRARASTALGNIGSKPGTVMPALIGRLKDDDASVRARAAEALGQFGPAAKDAAVALGELLDNPDRNCCCAAADALRRLGSQAEQAAPALARSLGTTDDPNVRAHAMCALVNLGDRVVPLLIKTLAEEPARQWAVMSLAELGSGAAPAVPALIGLLKDNDPNLRREVLLCLGQIGRDAEDAVPAMNLALVDRDASVRQAAAFALGNMGPLARSSLEAIQQATRQDDPLLRVVAARAMVLIDAQNKTTSVSTENLLLDGLAHDDVVVRRAASATLSEINLPGKQVVHSLIKSLTDGDREVTNNVMRALVNRGQQAVPSLTKAISEESTRLPAAVVLGRLGPEARPALTDLRACLKDDDPRVRHAAMVAIGGIGVDAGEAVADLAGLVEHDSEPALRRVAARTLGTIGSRAKQAVGQLSRATQSEDGELRMSAAMSLAHIEPTNAEVASLSVPILLAALQHEHPLIRLDAARALQQFGRLAKASLPALRKSLNDDEELVGAAARRAIEAIENPAN